MVICRMMSRTLVLVILASMQQRILMAGCTLRCRELSASVPGCIASCVPTLNTLRDTPTAASGQASAFDYTCWTPDRLERQLFLASNRTDHDPTSTCGTCASQSVNLTKAQLVVASVCAEHHSH